LRLDSATRIARVGSQRDPRKPKACRARCWQAANVKAAEPNQHDPEQPMKFMILVKSNPELEAEIEAMDGAEMKRSLARMGAFNDELKKAGVMKDCDGLRPSRDGKRVRFDGASRQVVDGPFAGDLVRAIGFGSCLQSTKPSPG
jgi:hypothetical protein